MTVHKISSNIPNLQPHESIDMFILMFHKEHTNADHVRLDEDRDLAAELEGHTGT